MSEPLLCVCGHADEDHDPFLGLCNICRCVVFRLEDEFEDEEDGELDFDHGESA